MFKGNAFLWAHEIFQRELVISGQTMLRFVLLRCDCSGDLRHHVCFSHHGQIHLHQEGDVSEPRSEICAAAGGQLRVPVQRPGRFSGCSQRKPKGVFYLATAQNELKRQKMNYQTVLYLVPLFSSLFFFLCEYYRLEMSWTFKRHWCCHF